MLYCMCWGLDLRDVAGLFLFLLEKCSFNNGGWGLRLPDLGYLISTITNCKLIILRLSSLSCIISTTTNCKLQYFGFQNSDIYFQQLQVASFNTSTSKTRMYYFNNFKFFAFRLDGGGCYCFFLQRKKSNQKKRRSGALPLRTPEGGCCANDM